MAGLEGLQQILEHLSQTLTQQLEAQSALAERRMTTFEQTMVEQSRQQTERLNMLQGYLETQHAAATAATSTTTTPVMPPAGAATAAAGTTPTHQQGPASPPGFTAAPGFMFPPGSTTVVYTFTDGAGNQADCTFVINVLIGSCCRSPGLCRTKQS